MSKTQQNTAKGVQFLRQSTSKILPVDSIDNVIQSRCKVAAKIKPRNALHEAVVGINYLVDTFANLYAYTSPIYIANPVVELIGKHLTNAAPVATIKRITNFLRKVRYGILNVASFKHVLIVRNIFTILLSIGTVVFIQNVQLVKSKDSFLQIL